MLFRSIGKKVLAVEDTSTTGDSVFAAIEALVGAGAKVAGVAVIVDRGASKYIEQKGFLYRALFSLKDFNL